MRTFIITLFCLLGQWALAQGFEGRLVWDVQTEGQPNSKVTWLIKNQLLSFETNFSTEHGNFTLQVVPSVYTGMFRLTTTGNDGVQNYKLPLSAIQGSLAIGSYQVQKTNLEPVDGHPVVKYIFTDAGRTVEVLVATDIQIPLIVYAPYFKTDYALQYLARENVNGFPISHKTTNAQGQVIAEAKLMQMFPEKIDAQVFNVD